MHTYPIGRKRGLTANPEDSRVRWASPEAMHRRGTGNASGEKIGALGGYGTERPIWHDFHFCIHWIF